MALAPPPSSGSPDEYSIVWDGFVQMVLAVTVSAYQTMLAAKVITSSWNEENITARFADEFLHNAGLNNIPPLYVFAHSRYNTPEILEGLVPAKQARELDVRMFQAWERDYNRICFTWECKLISDRLLDKTHDDLINEYVKEGMFRFIDNNYADCVEDGGMLGFIIVGDPDAIVQQINESMVSTRRARTLTTNDKLQQSPAINSFKHIYHSNHKRSTHDIQLHHLMLRF